MQRRQARPPRARRGVLVLLVGLVAATAVAPVADPVAAHEPPAAPLDYEGTATGSHRPGVTAAGLSQLTALDSAALWLGVPSKADSGARFDVQVELLNNGEVVASGLKQCVDRLDGPPPGQATQGGIGSPTEVAVEWNEFDPVTLAVGDVLALRVSARIGTTPNGSRCGGSDHASGLRVFYDATATPSRVGATISPDPAVTLNLHSAAAGCSPAELVLAEAAVDDGAPRCAESGAVQWSGGNAWTEVGTWELPEQCDCDNSLIPDVRTNPPAPEPEQVELDYVPMPPVPTDGVCDLTVNTQGCVSNIRSVGGFFDNGTISAGVEFDGAPQSIFAGAQLVAVKVDGSTFSNGTPWKCITCGIPPQNRQGAGTANDHPIPFHDGKRAFIGSTIVHCEDGLLTDACTPENTFRYPIRWNVTPDGSGNGGSMRELRVSPDGVHLSWNSFVIGTKLDQFTYIGRLVFNPAPTTGNPMVPRYDLADVYRLYSEDRPPWYVNPEDPGELSWNAVTPEVGESRGWSWDGEWVTYVGYPSTSSRIDLFRVHLQTGQVQQLTRHPEYTDPADLSPDGQWAVYLDTRGSGRQMFMGAMPGIPPLTDLISTSFVSSVRNEGQRRFFQPILIDIHGDRGAYEGQNLKDPAHTESCPGGQAPNSLCDLEWNPRADPHWSPDGTAIAYRELNGGGAEHADGTGRDSRAIIVRMIEREPQPYTAPAPTPDIVPWGEEYVPGSPTPFRNTLLPPEGTYTVNGAVFGTAEVTVTHFTGGSTPVVSDVAVSYANFSNDGVNVINGTERVVRLPESTPIMPHLEWYSDITLSGCQQGTKRTVGPDGAPGGPLRAAIDLFQTILFSEGELITTLDGVSYHKPPMTANHRPYSEL